jgi:hypothetical protein
MSMGPRELFIVLGALFLARGLAEGFEETYFQRQGLTDVGG